MPALLKPRKYIVLGFATEVQLIGSEEAYDSKTDKHQKLDN